MKQFLGIFFFGKQFDWFLKIPWLFVLVILNWIVESLDSNCLILFRVHPSRIYLSHVMLNFGNWLVSPLFFCTSINQISHPPKESISYFFWKFPPFVFELDKKLPGSCQSSTDFNARKMVVHIPFMQSYMGSYATLSLSLPFFIRFGWFCVKPNCFVSIFNF